ncbi:hypothetical protein N9Y48_04475 [Zobellia sp.]|nr:hypothetical protein [Zobellia sp.]
MRAFFLTISTCLLFLYNSFSQTPDEKDSPHTDSYITISPLSFLDYYVPRLRVGYIQHLGGPWKMGVDLGLGAGTGLFSQIESEDELLFEVRPELYYGLGKGSKTSKYISVELFYIDDSKTILNDGYERRDGVDILYDKADFQRQKYGMHVKFGLFLNLGRHFGFNFYGGIGFRFKNISFENMVNPREGIEEDLGHFFGTIYDTDKNDFRPNPSLGFKFYYRL